MLCTGVTIFRIQRLEAVATVGPSLLHDVALAAQDRLALEAAKVLHVPVSPLSFRALVRKDDLGTGSQTVIVSNTATRTHSEQHSLWKPQTQGSENRSYLQSCQQKLHALLILYYLCAHQSPPPANCHFLSIEEHDIWSGQWCTPA